MKKLLIPLMFITLISCGEIKLDSCPNLTHENGEKVYIVDDTTRVEVIINYSLHSMDHLNSDDISPCRYRISWIDRNDGSNRIGLITDKDIVK